MKWPLAGALGGGGGAALALVSREVAGGGTEAAGRARGGGGGAAAAVSGADDAVTGGSGDASTRAGGQPGTNGPTSARKAPQNQECQAADVCRPGLLMRNHTALQAHPASHHGIHSPHQFR